MTRLLPALFVALAAVAGCGEEDCTDGELVCDGDLLLACVDGKLEDSQDCAAEGLICHAEGDAHCMAADEEM